MRFVIDFACNRNLCLPQKVRPSLQQLADSLGLPKSTLHDESRRGTVRQPNLFREKEGWNYSVEIIQMPIAAGQINKARPMKMSTTTTQLLCIEIVEHHRSPYDALPIYLRKQGGAICPANGSFYDHTHHSDLGISSSQLPCNPLPHRNKPPQPRHRFKMPGNLSIEERLLPRRAFRVRALGN